MIHWLLQSLDDCPTIIGGHSPEGLLNEQEQQRLAALKVEKRRRDWLLGRWTAKHLVQSYLATTTGETVPLAALYIGNEGDGAPYVRRSEGQGAKGEAVRLPLSLAISHSHGSAFCALIGLEDQTASPLATRHSLGCDIEFVEPREPSFVKDFFTAQEMAAVAATTERDVVVTAIWSAKESVLKALRTGLRLDTRRIGCDLQPFDPLPQAWTSYGVTIDADLFIEFSGNWSAWWRVYEGFVLTMALREVKSLTTMAQ